MIIEQIKRSVRESLQNSFREMDISIDIIRSPQEFGDLCTTIPFKVAKILRKPPYEIADKICENISSGLFSSISVSKPGYINFTLSSDAWRMFLSELEAKGEDYYRKESNGIRFQVEFVSANPTGPLHVGNGRGGIIGDVLANLLSLQGFNVEREYYVNDAGSKMDLFAQSILYYYLLTFNKESSFPEDGYRGEYIKDIASDIAKSFGDKFINMDRKVALSEVKKIGKEMMIDSIKKSLEDFGVHFDNWFYESSLYESGELEETLRLFRNTPHTYEKDGAIWFKSTLFSDDKDRVLVRSTGEPTYILSDAAYHYNKWKRGFRRVVDVWGADHFGHIVPMKALIKGMGIPDDFLEIIIYQMVHLYEDGTEVTMSKHTGTFFTLEELINEVGKDAARVFFLLKSADTHLNFDINLAKSKSMDNPIYYLKYTYARLKGILREGDLRNISYSGAESLDLSTIQTQEERELMTSLIFVEESLNNAAKNYAVHEVPFFTIDLARKINAFYQKYRVLSPGKEMQGRLALVNASLIVLSILFDIMGIEKVERM